MNKTTVTNTPLIKYTGFYSITEYIANGLTADFKMFEATANSIPTFDASKEALWLSAPPSIMSGRRSIVDTDIVAGPIEFFIVTEAVFSTANTNDGAINFKEVGDTSSFTALDGTLTTDYY
mmetsp:Transcript_26527/g.4639  ORF Transcript_26527/g.4639 Transcript_26527/m.4639 type:complete len:121 (+) Transcript_26527:6930-7292(+)